MPALTFQFLSSMRGPAGATGLGYVATSVTSLAVEPGDRTFATTPAPPLLAYVVGSRIRLSSAADPTTFLEGLVTAKGATTFTVNVDNGGGSGTHADWVLSIAGDKGSSGRDGQNGRDGQDGRDGQNGQDGRDGQDGAQGAPGPANPLPLVEVDPTAQAYIDAGGKYVIQPGDRAIVCRTDLGAVVVELPPSVSGAEYLIFNQEIGPANFNLTSQTNPITINPPSGGRINGRNDSNGFVFHGRGQFARLLCKGSWQAILEGPPVLVLVEVDTVYQALPTDTLIGCKCANAQAAAGAVLLPAGTDDHNGHELRVFDVDGNAGIHPITITPADGEGLSTGGSFVQITTSSGEKRLTRWQSNAWAVA